MSYEPTVWKAGDTVTSAKLNKLEQGVAAGGDASVLRVNMIVSNDEYTLDKTAGEIYEAFQNGIVLISNENEEKIELLSRMAFENNKVLFMTHSYSFSASLQSDYPSGGGDK